MEYDLQKWLENADNEEYAKRVLLHVSEQADEIEKLRAALKAITEVPSDWGNEVYEMLEIAHAALSHIVDLDDVLLPPKKDSWI